MRAGWSGATKGVSADGVRAVETYPTANTSEPPCHRPEAPAGPGQTAHSTTEGLLQLFSVQ